MKINFFRRKPLAIALLLALLLALPGQLTLAADISIYINDRQLESDTPPQIINDRTYLPLRACAEAMQANVNYDNKSKTIRIIRNDVEIELTVGSMLAVVNGAARALDAEAKLINDRAMVPVRFVGEALSCEINWDSATAGVYIYTGSTGGSTTAPEIKVENNYTKDPDSPKTDGESALPAENSQTSGENTENNPPVQTAPDTPLPADALVEIPQLGSIVKDAMQMINNVRQQKELEGFLTTEELIAMAQAHAEDMAQNGFFSSQSPTLGSPTQRAESRSLPATSELIAKIDYAQTNVVTAVTAWLHKEPARSVLLNPSSGYIGIAAYHKEGTNEVYMVAEVLPTRAFFTNLPARSTTSSPELSLSGRSASRRETVFIYKLSEQNPAMYTAMRTVQANVANSYFFANALLWDKGDYAITVGGHTIYVTYN